MEAEELRATPIPISWKMTQDEENGNAVLPPLRNGSASSRPSIQKAESIEIVDCTLNDLL